MVKLAKKDKWLTITFHYVFHLNSPIYCTLLIKINHRNDSWNYFITEITILMVFSLTLMVPPSIFAPSMVRPGTVSVKVWRFHCVYISGVYISPSASHDFVETGGGLAWEVKYSPSRVPTDTSIFMTQLSKMKFIFAKYFAISRSLTRFISSYSKPMIFLF